jgi:hypothetical protein
LRVFWGLVMFAKSAYTYMSLCVSFLQSAHISTVRTRRTLTGS